MEVMRIEKVTDDRKPSFFKKLEEEWNLWDAIEDAGFESNEVKEVLGQELSHPKTIWSIETYYSSDHSLCFRLRTPYGASMLLLASEVIDCIHSLVSDSNDGIYFNVQDGQGHQIQTDSDQLKAHLEYIISVEKRKMGQRKGRDATSKKSKRRKWLKKRNA